MVWMHLAAAGEFGERCAGCIYDQPGITREVRRGAERGTASTGKGKARFPQSETPIRGTVLAKDYVRGGRAEESVLGPRPEALCGQEATGI